MTSKVTRDTIIDAALELAEARSWEAVRLHEVAASLALTLADVRMYFREKEELVDAWFDRADAALLRAAEDPALPAALPRERLQRLLMAWFGALARHQRPTREMIYGKFEFGHVHYQFAGLLRVSRTVQWWRDAARRDAVLPWRAFEEAGLTTIYLTTFFYWMRDDSDNAARTAAFLDRLLKRAEPFGRCLSAGAAPSGTKNRNPTDAHARNVS